MFLGWTPPLESCVVSFFNFSLPDCCELYLTELVTVLVPWIMVQNRQSLCNSLLIFLNNGDVMMNDDEIVLVSYLGTLLG